MTRSIAIAAGLALAACGNYSTEDLRFLAALPQREDLQVEVPAGGNPGAATVCGNGSAEVWLWAKPTSDGLNRGVEFVTGLVDLVRRVSPTYRETDLRRWGPFPDEKHPGREIQIVITRTYPAALGGAPEHAYAFQARPVGGEFRSIIGGTFRGASASRGSGTIVLDFQAIWDLGMNDASTPHGIMQIAYDRASEPMTIDLQLTNDGFDDKVVRMFSYGFAGYGDGSGAFDYAFYSGTHLLEVRASFDGSGAGKAAVDFFQRPRTLLGNFRECWDASACLTFVQDPNNYSGACAGAPCSIAGSCVDGPAPPF